MRKWQQRISGAQGHCSFVSVMQMNMRDCKAGAGPSWYKNILIHPSPHNKHIKKERGVSPNVSKALHGPSCTLSFFPFYNKWKQSSGLLSGERKEWEAEYHILFPLLNTWQGSELSIPIWHKQTKHRFLSDSHLHSSATFSYQSSAGRTQTHTLFKDT